MCLCELVNKCSNNQLFFSTVVFHDRRIDKFACLNSHNSGRGRNFLQFVKCGYWSRDYPFYQTHHTIVNKEIVKVESEVFVEQKFKEAVG